MKLEIIKPSEIRVQRSLSKSKIGGWHGLTSTMSTILKNKDGIQSSVLCGGRLMRQKIMHNTKKENLNPHSSSGFAVKHQLPYWFTDQLP